jgi:hypothetical protein
VTGRSEEGGHCHKALPLSHPGVTAKEEERGMLR